MPWDVAARSVRRAAHERRRRFRYDRADAFVDVDPRFYAARYLRAWQLQALITETLVERYDADWWRNPRAGPWIVQALFGEGAARAGARAGASAWPGRRCPSRR